MTGLAALVLADARFPGGGHVHSGGLEEAVSRGLVSGVDDLGRFVYGRLRTAGLVAAAFAAAAASAVRVACAGCPAGWGPCSGPHPSELGGQPGGGFGVAGLVRGQAPHPSGSVGSPGGASGMAESSPEEGFGSSVAPPGAGPGEAAGPDVPVRQQGGRLRGLWAELDAELDARTPSPAQREASRAQGRATLRAARAAWPSAMIDELVAVNPRPHHALLVGAIVGVSGGSPGEAARCVGYLAVSGPASAAVRLLGLDPFAVNAMLVRLAPVLDDVVAEAEAVAAGPPTCLPAPSAPVLDLMAQAHVHHHREQVRLFAS